MSRARPGAAEARMLEFGCDQCGAAPGEWCSVYRRGGFWNPGYHPAAMLHSSRFWAAHESGLLPLSGGAA